MLHRLADSLPVILAVEAAQQPVAAPDLVSLVPLPPHEIEVHLLKLEQEIWTRRLKDTSEWTLSNEGRDWLGQPGGWYVSMGPRFRREARAPALLSAERPSSGHPAQPILRWLSVDWPVFLTLQERRHASAKEMIEIPRSPDGWKPRHLEDFVDAGLLAVDRTPVEAGGPLYTIDHLGGRWMLDAVLTSIRATAHFAEGGELEQKKLMRNWT